MQGMAKGKLFKFLHSKLIKLIDFYIEIDEFN